jgi:hypothetical protein
MRRRLFPLVLLFVFTAVTAVSALAGPEKVGPLLRKYVDPHLSVAVDPVQHQTAEGVLNAASSGLGVRCLIQGDVTRQELEALGITVTSRAGAVFSTYVPPSAVLAVSNLPGVVRIQAARKLKPNLDVATSETNIVPEVHGQTGPAYGGNTGSNVVVGDVDSGFDYKHEDFKLSGGTSRFDRIWDQTNPSGPSPSYGYGTEYLQAALTGGTPVITNPDGHGTHVMGIQGGNGRGTGNGYAAYRYTGVAPDATLIGVKTDFTDAGIVDGVDYIFQRAAALGKNAVVNLSIGGQYGPHDGTDPFDVAISALTGPGKIVVASAGNERGAAIHARGQLPATGTPSVLNLTYSVGTYTANPGTQNDIVLFDGYYESTDNYSVTVISPNGIVTGPITRGNSTGVDTNDGAVQIENGVNTNSTGDYEVFVAFFDYLAAHKPAAGTWTIRYTRTISTNSYIDLWNYVNSSNISGSFTSNVTDDVTIGTPGSSLDVITVAAYTTKTTWNSIDGHTYQFVSAPPYGALAPFSSRGPLRDGTQKPDISGPGFGIVSTLASDANTSGNQPYIDPDGQHWMQAGTSMSSPMVAGLCALILNKDGALTPAQMKTKLYNTARTDTYTGAVPNPDWGYGKMNGLPADMTAPTVTVSAPNGGEVLAAGSSTNITWSASDNFAVDHVDLYYSTDSGSTFPNLIASGEANDGTYAWSVPSISTTTARVKVVAVDAGGNTGEDQSNADFTIQVPDTTPPTVTVTAPNGGESLAEGSTFDITWNASDTGMKPSGVTGVAAIAGVDSVTIAYSNDNGSSWIPVASGEANDGTYSWTVPNDPTTQALVRVQAYDPSLNVGSDVSDAVFSITASTAVPTGGIPTVLNLAQNRPNPVTGAASTRISFGLTREGPVTLRVFDASGSEVAVLARGTYPAGTYAVDWNGLTETGGRASSGLYFYRLETREGTITRKLMVLK